MKILWITNKSFAHHNVMLGINDDKPAGGSWLVAAYESVRNRHDIELTIATPYGGQKIKTEVSDGCNFVLVPGGYIRTFDEKSIINRNNCIELKKISSPDLVVIWGTEARFAYLVSEVFNDIPQVVYIQGVVRSILNHYYDGVPFKYRYNTIRDIFNKFYSQSDINAFKKQAKLEACILKNAKGVIVENDWCEDQCKLLNPQIEIYRNKLPIRSQFFNVDWEIDTIEQYSIFTNAGGYSIKGHHILFQALAVVKQRFPKVKLYIPGPKYLEQVNSIKSQTGYAKMLCEIIKKNNLVDNIQFVGGLSTEEMANRLRSCHIYAMPSVCENHSASLIEAMIVGVPCVSSVVGGVGNLIDNYKNGIIYNSLEPESLAGAICRIFSDYNLAMSLSSNAKKIRESRKTDFGNEMIDICKDILNNYERQY